MRWIAWALVAALPVACAGATEDDAPPTAAASAPAGDAPRASAPVAARPSAATPPQPASYELAIEPIDAERGEDGRGRLVEATAPRAVIVRAGSWPGRALDPVLYVGRLRFQHYDHPDKRTLRYVVADIALLPVGAEVALQYGNDARSRVVLSTALEVQP